MISFSKLTLTFHKTWTAVKIAPLKTAGSLQLSKLLRNKMQYCSIIVYLLVLKVQKTYLKLHKCQHICNNTAVCDL